MRDAADTTDVLVVSSVRGDPHPDTVDAPSGDGAEFDPVTGSYRSGSMTYRIADSITSGTSRLVTAQLEDASFRQQLTSRPAYIEEAVNGGAWNVIQAGIVTALRLASAASWEIDVGDTTRATRNLVAFAPKRNATDATKVEAFADYLARWPTRGCVAGGPILGGFLGRSDLGGWEVLVARATTWNGLAVKALQITAAYFPSGFGRTTRPTPDQIRPVDDAAGPASAMPLPQTFAADFAPSPWPDLIVKVGTHYYAAASFAMAGDTWYNPAVGGALIGVSRFSGYLTLYVFDPGGTLTVGTGGLRLSLFDAIPSARSVLFYQGHPLDLWTKLCDESALRYDAAAVTATKALLGNNLRITLEIPAPQDWASFVESTLYGPCGFSVRTATDGTLVPFTTRTGITALPSVTVANVDVSQDGNALFDLSEPDAITKLTVQQTNLSAQTTSDQNLPLDGLARQSVQVIRTSGDAGGPVQREQTYTIPGFLDTGSGAYEPGLVDAMAKSLFDRFGRGRLVGETTLLRAGAGGGVVLGQEILVGLRAMPNHNKRLGDDGTVGARCVQIVRLTPTPSGPHVRFVDSGPNANPASPLPTLSLAAGPPGAGLALTITNAATLNAASPPITVRVQWAAVASGTPASGDYTDVLLFPAGAVPTGTTLLPLAAAGYTVYVQARSEDALHRPSAWTTPISLASVAMGAPTGVSVTVDATDGSRATVAWTTGTNAGGALTDIYLRLSTLTFADAIRMASGLLGGTISYPLAGLVTTLSYIVTVVHRDPVTGATTSAEFTFTAGSTTRTLSPPVNPIGIVGSSDPVTGVGQLDGTYGLDVTAVELPGFVTFWEATETGIGTGTYGAATQVSGMVPSVSGGPTSWRGVSANQLLRKQLTARHEAPGANPSTYTGVVTLAAWGVIQQPARDLTPWSISDLRQTDGASTSVISFVRGPETSEVWGASAVVSVPLADTDWDPVVASLAPLAVDSITVTRPADSQATLVQLVPYRADGTPGTVVRRVLYGLPQVPTWQYDDLEVNGIGTQWLKLVERGLAVTSVQAQSQVASGDFTSFAAPTRGPGATSVVKGGTLGANEYEQDVPLSTIKGRQSFIRFQWTLDNGTTVTSPDFAFDADRQPNIVNIAHVGGTYTISGDSDVKAILLGSLTRGWSVLVDGQFLTYDVTALDPQGATGLGANATDTFLVRVFNEPAAEVAAGGYTTPPSSPGLYQDQQVTFYNGTGTGGTGGSPLATWLSVTAAAPSLAHNLTQISLKASAAPSGWTVKVFLADPETAPMNDVTSSLSPALTAPPTTLTAYTIATETRTGSGGDSTLITLIGRAELRDGSGVVQDSKTFSVSYYA